MWVYKQIVNNNGIFPTEFTIQQRIEYLELVNQFQRYHSGTPYGCPVDSTLSFPSTIIAKIFKFKLLMKKTWLIIWQLRIL